MPLHFTTGAAVAWFVIGAVQNISDTAICDTQHQEEGLDGHCGRCTLCADRRQPLLPAHISASRATWQYCHRIAHWTAVRVEAPVNTKVAPWIDVDF
jgi:7-cyano-7-deazaguanine synthase in queuosine biosynthesis